MEIERAVLGVNTLGPGNRFVVWVNGCEKHCKGCVSERLQKKCPENERDVISFLSEFDFTDVDGVTISGGEPFDQIVDLEKMVAYLFETGIRDILIYTGYTKEQLEVWQDDRVKSIFSKIAVLIDGPYVSELDFGEDNLKGSINQRIFYFNDKLKNKYLMYHKKERKMQELNIGNYSLAVGIPDRKFIHRFTKK